MATSYCDTATGACKSDLANGQPCTAASQCGSGNCVDAVCCDTACNGLCEACTALLKGSGTTGLCGFITGDKDLFQLIGEDVKIYDTMKEEVYGPQECVKKFGVTPAQIPELLGLMGDTSDNIPGVPGVGPKTALELIAEFGTIENLLGNLDKVKKPKLRENLASHAEDARLSRRLVELDTELPEDVEIEGLKRRPQKSDELINVFKELEFTALLKFVTHDETAHQTAEYITVKEEKILRSLMADAKKAGYLAVNTETTSWLPMDGDAVGISFCFADDRAYYVPFGHVSADAGDLFPAPASGQLSQGSVVEIMRPVLEDAGVVKYGHNVKYDIIVLKNLGVELRGVAFDAMVGSYLLNPGRANHSLENVCLEYLSHKKMTIAEVIGTGMKQIIKAAMLRYPTILLVRPTGMSSMSVGGWAGFTRNETNSQMAQPVHQNDRTIRPSMAA